MNSAHFDRMTRSLADSKTRRSLLRAAAAMGLNGALLAKRSAPAAADCSDGFLNCGIPAPTGGYYDRGSAGVYGRCWNWSTFTCEFCPGVMEAATRHCNEFHSQTCAGQCVAW